MAATQPTEGAQRLKRSWRALFWVFGPGFITGAADDDPSGIATAAQAGAQFGYSLLWTVLLAYPLMTAVQEACARIGAATRKGLAKNISERYGRFVLSFAVALLTCANTINIAADLEGMAAALRLLIPLPMFVGASILVVIIVVLEVFVSYTAYARILKWFSLSLLSYVLVALIVQEPWDTLARATFIPQVSLHFTSLFIIVGLLGTTITPYMFFWEASEEVEEALAGKLGPWRIWARGSKPSSRLLQHLRIDNIVGMFISQLITWFIMVASATVLHAHGVTTITTAADAAQALEPLVRTFPHAGTLAKVLFASGVLGLGMLAVPVLAGSSAYSLAEAMAWREGLSSRFRDAPGFYGIIILSTLVGLGLQWIGVNPVRALVLAAVFNGVVAVPLLYMIGQIAADQTIMGDFRSKRLSRFLIACAALLMGASALAMFITLARG